jgi:hypothetical protein
MQAAQQQQLAQQPSTILITNILGKYITAAPIPPLNSLEKLESLLYGLIEFIGQAPSSQRMKDLIRSIVNIINTSPNETDASVKVANAFLRLLRMGVRREIGIEEEVFPNVTEENIEGFYQWFRATYSERLIRLGIPYQQETSANQITPTSIESVMRHDLFEAFNSPEEINWRERLHQQSNRALDSAAANELDRIRNIHTASAYSQAARNQQQDNSRYLAEQKRYLEEAELSRIQSEKKKRRAEEINEVLTEGWKPSFTQIPNSKKGGYKRQNSKKTKKTNENKKRKTINNKSRRRKSRKH